MVQYVCKGCGALTGNSDRICIRCRDKVADIRTIKAMLMPYYNLKKELERRHMWEAAKAEAEREKDD